MAQNLDAELLVFQTRKGGVAGEEIRKAFLAGDFIEAPRVSRSEEVFRTVVGERLAADEGSIAEQVDVEMVFAAWSGAERAGFLFFRDVAMHLDVEERAELQVEPFVADPTVPFVGVFGEVAPGSPGKSGLEEVEAAGGDFSFLPRELEQAEEVEFPELVEAELRRAFEDRAVIGGREKSLVVRFVERSEEIGGGVGSCVKFSFVS